MSSVEIALYAVILSALGVTFDNSIVLICALVLVGVALDTVIEEWWRVRK